MLWLGGLMKAFEAIDYDGLECPNNSPVGCAASVAGCSPALIVLHRRGVKRLGVWNLVTGFPV